MSRAAARPHVVAITLLPGSQETAGLSVNLQYLVEDILKPLAEELNVVYYIVLRHCMVLVELDGASTSYSLNLLVNRLMKQGLHVEFVGKQTQCQAQKACSSFLVPGCNKLISAICNQTYEVGI